VKIAFLNEGIYEYASGSPEAVGGTERDLWLLSRALAAAGWSATVGVRHALKPGELKKIEGVDYVGIDQGQTLLAWHRFLLSERPDWLFWESATHLLGPLVDIAKLVGVRTIFHAAFDTDVEPRRALCWRPRLWPLYAWGLLRTDRIFVQHTGQLSKLAPRWQSKAYVLPKVCTFSRCGDEDLTVKRHTERTNYVAWVAMLRQPKRPDLLVEIAKGMPATRFVVCGGPSQHRSPPGYGERIIEDLRALPNVEYLGQVPPQKAAEVIADASILLSTSDAEGFPNTFTQAWSAGTPIVTLTIDPDGVIKRLGLGAVSGNIEQAIADINALMDSPERRNEIAIRARQFIAKNCSAAAVATLFERALQGFH
jgi:glycosyltransferase involved in cell wall biosynthesis